MHALSIHTFRTGPLIGTWCMRMEGKNSYFKRAAQSSKFKNVSYTAAKKHQRLLCAYLQSDNLFDRSLECGPGTFLTISSTSVCCTYTCTCACILLQIGKEPKQLPAEDPVIIAKVRESAQKPMCTSTTTNLVHRYTASHTYCACICPPPLSQLPVHSSTFFPSPYPCVHTHTHTHTRTHTHTHTQKSGLYTWVSSIYSQTTYFLDGKKMIYQFLVVFSTLLFSITIPCLG